MTFGREGMVNIAVFRALKGLGDMLCCVPALRALRAAYPESCVTLIGLREGRWIADRFPSYVDRFEEFPGWSGLPEQQPVDPDRVEAFVRRMSAERFQLAVQMHGSGTISNTVVAALKPKNQVGFVPPGAARPNEGLFAQYPDYLHEVHRCLTLVRMVGAPVGDDSLEFPVDVRDRQDAADSWPAAGGAPYVCLHPGSSSPDRRWAAERFAEVADALAEQGLRVVLTGSVREAEVTRSVARAARAEVVDLAGRTTLGGLAALLRDAQCLVCNDTGVSHLAEALRVPSVVVFPRAKAGPAVEPHRWAPLDGRLHRVLHECSASSPCRGDIECLPEVCASDVIDAAQRLIGEGAYVG